MAIFLPPSALPTPVTSGGLTIHISSLSNDPLIERAALHRSDDFWQLDVTAHFANACLADTGISVRHADRGTTGEGFLRIIHLQQLRPEDGCPDIFRPVSRNFSVLTQFDARLEKAVILNCAERVAASQQLRPTRSQLCVLPAKGPAFDNGAFVEAPRIVSQPWGYRLPVLHSPRIKSLGAESRNLQIIQIEFSVILSPDCPAGQDIDAEILEGRFGYGEEAIEPVKEWIVISEKTASKTEACTADAGTTLSRRYTVSHEASKNQGRRIFFLNEIDKAPENGLFHSIDIP